MARRIVDLDRLTAATVRDGALDGRSVTVLGLARSGIAMARFFADTGARVTVYDGRPADDLRSAIDALGGRSIELELGPDVDPAGTWADADLVATSPSINPDFPTAEPRLRAALAELVAAHRADPSGAPALVSEPDLVLRMCPCPTIGVTGTKGKTTTSSLITALLAQDAAHPAILGGNIGIPLIERLPELTPGHRVVIELSELQLPTLSRGTTVAVYTNVTSDHLDRHGSVASYRAVKRRLAELADPAGALVLSRTGGSRRYRAALASLTAGSWPWACDASRWPAAALQNWGRAAGSCRSPSSLSQALTTSRTPWLRWRLRCFSASLLGRSAAPPRHSREWNIASNRSPASTVCASSTTRRGPSRTR